MIESALLRLPSEIRIEIYQFLFDLDRWQIPRLAGASKSQAGCCDVNVHNDHVYTRRKWGTYSFTNFAAILATCRLMNSEATDVLYEQTIFMIKMSNEQYNRRMRLYAPLVDCPFLHRIQRVMITPDVRQHAALLALPDALDQVLMQLRCPTSAIQVELTLSSGCLMGFTPWMASAEPSSEDASWTKLLLALSNLKDKCRFVAKTTSFRVNVEQRANQIVSAVSR